MEVLFASVPVANLQVATDWYERLFARAPDIVPNSNEVMWRVAGNGARTQSVNHVAGALTALLLTVAAISILFVTWATIIETRPTNALARALGASPRQFTTGLTATQVIAALAGLPAGFVLYAVVGGNPTRTNLPVLLFLAIIPITMTAVAALAAIPARIAALAPVAPSLRSD